MNEENEILSNPKILLAEDNEINSKLIICVLKSKNMICDVAVNGEEALMACLQKDYDVILMDCQMPVMDGYESTLKIREAEGDKKHTIIIAMTANAMEGEREKCLKYGMDNYISKPIDFEVMFEMIENYTRNNKHKNWLFLEEYVTKLAADTGFSKNDARELIYEFTSSLPETLNVINEALKNGNYEEIKRMAHQMKGTSGNLRIKVLPNLAIKLQKFSEEKDAENCKQVLIEIKKVFE